MPMNFPHMLPVLYPRVNEHRSGKPNVSLANDRCMVGCLSVSTLQTNPISSTQCKYIRIYLQYLPILSRIHCSASYMPSRC